MLFMTRGKRNIITVHPHQQLEFKRMAHTAEVGKSHSFYSSSKTSFVMPYFCAFVIFIFPLKFLSVCYVFFFFAIFLVLFFLFEFKLLVCSLEKKLSSDWLEKL